MQDIELVLKTKLSDSFLAQKAKNSVDLNDEEKSKHSIRIENVDLSGDWSIGLIVGASGSGKTTLAKKIFGDFIDFQFDKTKAIIDQFPKEFTYDEINKQLCAIGLTSVPCWLKPLGVLSNGQQERAKIALALANNITNIFDEWTSVVDRTVATCMSSSISKYARKQKKQIVLLSCHYDVIPCLEPDWIIDCNEQKFEKNPIISKKKINFDIKKCSKQQWRNFSKYHYLAETTPGGLNYIFGLYHEDKQIGIQFFSEYVPWKDKKQKRILHFNRTVIHPDYVGLGLGMKLINATSEIMYKQGFIIMGKFSSVPVYKSMSRDKNWVLINQHYLTPRGSGNIVRNKNNTSTYRNKVLWWSFKYRPTKDQVNND